MQKIRQGETYPIFINLVQDRQTLTPDMIADMKVCIGKTFSKTYQTGGVGFYEKTKQWYIFPTQQETLSMPVGNHDLCVHVKYKSGYVLIDTIDRIRVLSACCDDVFGGDSGGGQISGPGGGQIDGKLPGELVIGIPGKSAYEYAVDGGYTGSETEFTAKLAEDYTVAFGLLVSILRAAKYEEDKTSDIDMLAKLLGVEAGDDPGTDEPDVPDEPDEPEIPDDPVIPKLATPVIRLETVEEPCEPDEPSDTGNTPAILGVAILGRTILGKYESDLPKLNAPTIRLVTVGDDAQKLDTPVIRLEESPVIPEEPEIPKLNTPVIRLDEEIMVLTAPIIELVEV